MIVISRLKLSDLLVHDSDFCVTTGELRRWVGSVREGTPKAPEDLMKGWKRSPLKVYEAEEVSGHIWIAQ